MCAWTATARAVISETALGWSAPLHSSCLMRGLLLVIGWSEVGAPGTQFSSCSETAEATGEVGRQKLQVCNRIGYPGGRDPYAEPTKGISCAKIAVNLAASRRKRREKSQQISLSSFA
jgi:hypothetical protein